MTLTPPHPPTHTNTAPPASARTHPAVVRMYGTRGLARIAPHDQRPVRRAAVHDTRR